MVINITGIYTHHALPGGPRVSVMVETNGGDGMGNIMPWSAYPAVCTRTNRSNIYILGDSGSSSFYTERFGGALAMHLTVGIYDYGRRNTCSTHVTNPIFIHQAIEIMESLEHLKYVHELQEHEVLIRIVKSKA